MGRKQLWTIVACGVVVGERRLFRMAWIFAPDLTVHAQPWPYRRLADGLLVVENLDGSGFEQKLPVEEDGMVLDYPARSGG